MLPPDLVVEHLGKLHPFEQLLVVVVAFGPFLVLAFVVRAARRRAIEEESLVEQAQASRREPPVETTDPSSDQQS